jgi:hypothetical protein
MLDSRKLAAGVKIEVSEPFRPPSRTTCNWRCVRDRLRGEILCDGGRNGHEKQHEVFLWGEAWAETPAIE